MATDTILWIRLYRLKQKSFKFWLLPLKVWPIILDDTTIAVSKFVQYKETRTGEIDILKFAIIETVEIIEHSKVSDRYLVANIRRLRTLSSKCNPAYIVRLETGNRKSENIQ